MTQLTCLFIKPKPSTPGGQITQQDDIRDYIDPAITNADLKIIGRRDGIFIENDIPQQLIRQLYDADVVVIDANRYESETLYSLSPFLYYLMGVHHALNNRTILISASRTHLPATLQMHHTLFYERTVPGARQFAQNFGTLLEQIKENGDNGEPGNPVQFYRRHKEQLEHEQELARLRAEAQASKEAKEKLAEELRREKEKKQAGERPSTPPQRIQFRKLDN